MGIKIKQIDGLQTALDNAGNGTPTTIEVHRVTGLTSTPYSEEEGYHELDLTSVFSGISSKLRKDNVGNLANWYHTGGLNAFAQEIGHVISVECNGVDILLQSVQLKADFSEYSLGAGILLTEYPIAADDIIVVRYIAYMEFSDE